MFKKIWEYLKIWEYPKITLDPGGKVPEDQLPIHIISTEGYWATIGYPLILRPLLDKVDKIALIHEIKGRWIVPTVLSEDSFELTQKQNYKFHLYNKSVLVPYGTKINISSDFLIFECDHIPVFITLPVLSEDSFELQDQRYFEEINNG